MLYAHLFALAAALDLRWAPPRQFFWFNLGTAAVLMFFVLSGYVIGLTTVRAPTLGEMRRYLLRRALRLMPVNTAAVLLAWALLPSLGAGTVVGNLLFLQNSAPYPGGFAVPVLPNNPNLWSLNYEVFYYLGFLALWRWAPRAGLVWAALIAVTLSPLAGFAPASLLTRLTCGALFWFAGLCIAWQTPPASNAPRRTEWPAALLCAYAVWTLAPLRTLFYVCHVETLLWPAVAAPHRLDFLPACLWLLLAATGRAPTLRRALGWLCLGWATAAVCYYAATAALVEFDLVATAALALAWPAFFWQPGLGALARLAPIGTLSFAIYAVALPIQLAQRFWFPQFSGTALTFFFRAAFVIAVTFGLAWLLEHQLQLWLRRRLANFPRETVPPANSTA